MQRQRSRTQVQQEQAQYAVSRAIGKLIEEQGEFSQRAVRQRLAPVHDQYQDYMGSSARDFLLAQADRYLKEHGYEYRNLGTVRHWTRRE